MKTHRFLLMIALILGLITRVFFLSDRPMGLTWDEAALGYNAYSLLQTGRDEWGTVAPVIFKSFGDYKPGLYVYFTVLPTAIFGLNEFSTRLPSAIFGTLTIAVIYLLVRQLFPNQKKLAAVTLFVAALNPWLIHFSRGAWEANLNLFLTTLATVSLIKGIKARSGFWYIFSAVFFGLTFLTYQSAKMFTPLLLVSLLLIFRKQLEFKKLLPVFIVLLVFLFPVLSGLSSQSGRLKVFSVFSYNRGSDYVGQLLADDGTKTKNWIYYLYHTELLDQLRGVYQRYLNHFSPRYLFVEGDWTNLRHSPFRQGLFYLFDFAPLILGLVALLRLRSRSMWVLVVWALLSPLPSSLSRDLISAVRSLPLAVPLVIFVSAGVTTIISHKWFRYIYIFPTLFVMFYFFEFYFFHAHHYAAEHWVSAYKPAIQVIAENRNLYPKVYFTDQLGQPYIFILYYLRYDPAAFRSEVRYEANASGDVGRVTGFGDYEFRPIFWPGLRGETGSMFIGGQYELPEIDLINVRGLTRLADITYPNGAPALRIVGLK